MKLSKNIRSVIYEFMSLLELLSNISCLSKGERKLLLQIKLESTKCVAIDVKYDLGV